MKKDNCKQQIFVFAILLAISQKKPQKTTMNMIVYKVSLYLHFPVSLSVITLKIDFEMYSPIK